MQSVCQPFPPTDLGRRPAQTVRDCSSSYKIDYTIGTKNFLNPEVHQNPVNGSKVMAIFTEVVAFAYWWSSSGGGSAINRASPSSFFKTPIYL